MIDFRLGRHALGVCVGTAMLAGCSGSQPPLAVSGAMPRPARQERERHRTFDYSGQVEYFKVPRDQKKITIIADGATGGFWQTSGSGSGIGGQGGLLEATIRVKPGELLRIFVGAHPRSTTSSAATAAITAAVREVSVITDAAVHVTTSVVAAAVLQTSARVAVR